MDDHSRSRGWEAGSAAVPWGPAITLTSGATRWLDLCYCVVWGHRPQYLDLTVPVHEPGTKVPVVLWVHGGSWSQGTNKRLSEGVFEYDYLTRLVANGFAVAAVDYRKVLETDWSGMCLDLRAAVRWLRNFADVFDLDTDRFAYWGESAGAHLALLTSLLPRLQSSPVVGDYVAQREDVQAIVNWYGPTDFTAFLAEKDTLPGWTDLPLSRLVRGDWEMLLKISPALLVRSDLPMPPVFTAHGSADAVVPIEQAVLLQERMTAAGHYNEFLAVPKADHVFLGASSQQVNAVIDDSIDFLLRMLVVDGSSA